MAPIGSKQTFQLAFVEDAGHFIDLHDYEIQKAVRAVGVSMTTVFEGSFPEQELRHRVAGILSANPWLAGRLQTNPASGKPAIWSCPLQEPSAFLELVPVVDDADAVRFYDGFSVGRGWQLLDKDEPICRIAALIEPRSNRWSLHMSMCHMVSDAFTLYTVYKMLDSDGLVWPMQVERVRFDPTESLRLTSFDGDCPAFCKGTGERKPILQIRYVREEWVREQQEAFAAEVDAPFISSNDVLTSWFYQATRPACGVFAFNLRNRSPGVHDAMAGCYSTHVVLCPEEYKSPANIRRAVTRMSAACTPDGKPQTWSGNGLGVVTAWHSFYHDLTLHGCRQLLHSPAMTINSVPVAIIFRPAKGRLAMVTMTEEQLPAGPLGDAVLGMDAYMHSLLKNWEA